MQNTLVLKLIMNMDQKNSEEQLNDNSRLKGRITKSGKARAVYTLKCKFNDGNVFTYRSDVNLSNYFKQGYKNINELDAIILKFTSLQALIFECKLFDNRKPAGEDLLLHYSGAVSKVLLNNLPKQYKL